MPVAEPVVHVPPAHLWVPPHASSSGADAADLAASAGLILDGEQRLILDTLLAEKADGYWAAFEAGVVMARQNGKTIALQALALFKLFLLQDRLTVWTAHEYPTAAEAFRDIEVLIDGAPHLKRKVKHVSKTNGEEGFELHSGARLNFRARSKKAGRGLSGNTVILDEAFALTGSHMGSLLPTLRAVPNSQVVYASSAGHEMSKILRGIRDRGRKGGSPSLAYIEWCAPRRPCVVKDCDHRVRVPGCVVDDESGWYAANPTLGRRVAITAMRAEREALPVEEFIRECLGWWEDPPPETGGALDTDVWALRADADAPRGRQVVFGLDVAEDRSATLAVGWRRPDRALQVQLVEAWPTTQDAVRRCAEVTRDWGGHVIVGGAAEALLPELQNARVPVETMTGRDFVRACGLLEDAVDAGTLRHGNQPELNEAVRVAKWRPVGTSGERAWLLKDQTAVGPLVAVTRVVHGLAVGRPSAPAPKTLPATEQASDSTSLATAGF